MREAQLQDPTSALGINYDTMYLISNVWRDCATVIEVGDVLACWTVDKVYEFKL